VISDIKDWGRTQLITNLKPTTSIFCIQIVLAMY